MMVARSTDWRWDWTVCVFIVHTDSSKVSDQRVQDDRCFLFFQL